jgi:ribosomal protein S25
LKAEDKGMGGAKKKSLSAMEKAQRIKEERDRRDKRDKAREEKEKRTSIAFALQNIDEKTLLSELSKYRAITPSVIASNFNIHVGAAEDLLEDWHHKGWVSFVAGCERLKIYRLNIRSKPSPP